MRKLPPLGSGAPPIPLVGASDFLAGRRVYPVEVDGTTFDLMERFGGLDARKVDNKRAVAAALGRLWHRALAALLRDVESRPPSV